MTPTSMRGCTSVPLGEGVVEDVGVGAFLAQAAAVNDHQVEHQPGASGVLQGRGAKSKLELDLA